LVLEIRDSCGDGLAADLASFLRDLAGIKPGETPLTNADIRSILQNMTGRDWSSYFRDYIEGTQEIPASSFSSFNVAQPEETTSPIETPRGSTSTSGWILIAVAVIIVLLIPFVLEPYTMRPRKPGFLEKELEEYEDEEEEED
jgi:hypothetical protein